MTSLPNTEAAPLIEPAPPKPVRLAIKLEPAQSGSITIGPDELEAEDVPTSISYHTELPGGFGPGDFTLPLPPGSPAPKSWLLGGVVVFDADTKQVYYEGRVTNVSSDTSASTVTVETEGWAKHLYDDETAAEIFIDRDLSKWGEPSVQRKIDILEAKFAERGYVFSQEVKTTPASGEVGSGVVFTLGSVGTGTTPFAETWYYGDGVDIGSLRYDYKVLSPDGGDANVDDRAFLTSDDRALSNDAGTIHQQNTALDQSVSSTVTGRKYAMMQTAYLANLPTAVYRNQRGFMNLAAIGRHGLTTQGTWPDIGFLVSDMAAYAVGRWAPLLDFTTGTEGTIETTSFAVPHSVFTGNTTVGAMLESWVLFGGKDNEPLQWGVYEGRRLFMCQASNFGRVWRVRQDQTARSQDQGADSSERINGVKVVYDRGDGQTRSVGPVGSQSTIETDELLDTNPANPANADGAKHWRTYNAGVMNDGQAKLVAGLILALSVEERWRGTIVIEGWGTDESGAKLPAALARAGDWVVVEDDSSGDTAPRQVRNTGFDGKAASCSVGAPPDMLDVLLARSGITLQGKT